MTERKQLNLFECCEELLECYKCGEYKPCSEFYKANKRKRGYKNWCKMCCKQYNKDNAEHIRQKNKQWREDNAEHKKQYDKQWREDNTEHIKQKHKQWREDNPEHLKQYNTSPFKSDDTTQKLKDIKIYESHEIDKDGDVNFKCAYCGIFFKTSRLEVQHRLAAINGINKGENRFYCSNQCKEECPTYGQCIYTKGHKTSLSREVQPQLRQMVLLRDNYTCQKCGWHKDDLSVGLHCHHIWPLNESPITSADMDECITYCKDCHIEVHKTLPGCGYGEMRCSIDHDKMLV